MASVMRGASRVMVTVAVSAPAPAGTQPVTPAAGVMVTVKVSPASSASSRAIGITSVPPVAPPVTVTRAGTLPSTSSAPAVPLKSVLTAKSSPPSGAASLRVIFAVALLPSGAVTSAMA